VTNAERAAVLRLITAAMLRSNGPNHHGFRDNYEWYGRSERTWQELRDAIANAEQIIKE
jgi:hypothetical protein